MKKWSGSRLRSLTFCIELQTIKIVLEFFFKENRREGLAVCRIDRFDTRVEDIPPALINLRQILSDHRVVGSPGYERKFHGDIPDECGLPFDDH